MRIVGISVSRAQVLQSAGSTLILVFGSLLIAALLGLPLGLGAAFLPRHWASRIAVAISVVVSEIPPFTVAVFCVLIFAMWLRWFPTTDTIETVRGTILPMFTLALMNVGYITKFMQTGMQEVLQRDYLTAAKSRGAGGVHMIFRHALRPAAGAVVTFFGPQTVTTLIGTVMVQAAFSMPGLLEPLPARCGKVRASDPSRWRHRLHPGGEARSSDGKTPRSEFRSGRWRDWGEAPRERWGEEEVPTSPWQVFLMARDSCG